MPRTTPDWKKDKVLELYSQGVSQIEIEEELQMTRKTIRELIKSSDLHYKTKSEQWLIRYSNKLNETVFDKLTPEALYWIGFLYADGHITKERGYSIELALKKEDREHLMKFKIFLSASNPIRDFKKGEASRIRIGSQKLWQKLKDLGFDNNKSFTAKPHELLKNSRDFWRGVVDGDGGVHTNYKSVTLCGTYETIKGFIEFYKSNKKPSKASGKELYQVHFYGKEADEIADLLYKDSEIYLDRKYEKYKKFLVLRCSEMIKVPGL